MLLYEVLAHLQTKTISLCTAAPQLVLLVYLDQFRLVLKV